MDVRRDDRRLGTGLVAGGLAPFAAGAVIPVSMVLDGPAACPFRAMTGIPCPLCGATRAFVLAGHGDGGFVDYGAFWLLIAAAAIVVGVLLLAGTLAGDGLRTTYRTPRRIIPVTAVLLAAGWAWALAHRETITA